MRAVNDGTNPPFKDHFSGHAAAYAAYRPAYPRELLRFLAACCERQGTAWDCATGNGQTALALTAWFERVIATDASAAQLEAAPAHPRVEYRVAFAEQPGLAPRSVDLITVAQALHWFDIDRFFDAALEVLVPGGVLAAWSYKFCSVDSAIDELVSTLYRALEPYWPPERRLVEEGYGGIALPMRAVAAPDFEMTAEWSAADMLGYLRTWSASRRHLRQHGEDPVDSVEAPLQEAWGEGKRSVRWPLSLKIGRA